MKSFLADPNFIYVGALLISALVGSLLLFFLKKFLVEASTKFKSDILGVIERPAITLLVALGRPYVYLIIIVITIKNVIYLSRLSRSLALLSRGEASLAYQKVKFKEILAIDLIVGPLFAVLVGIILTSLIR